MYTRINKYKYKWNDKENVSYNFLCALYNAIKLQQPGSKIHFTTISFCDKLHVVLAFGQRLCAELKLVTHAEMIL